MDKEEYELFREFCKIRNKGWIKSLRNGPTGIGYTFETLLNKKEDNLPIPDYKGIEIKTMRYLSKKKIHLFNCTPNKSEENLIEKIKNKYGYPDKEYPKYKVFNVSLNAKEPVNIGYKKLFLKVNRKKRIIEMICLTAFGFRINLDVNWSFDILKEIIETKIKKMAIVKACYKKINNENYYLYSRIDFFQIKSFDTFIELVENGTISITFKIGIWKDKNKFGQTHDRGTDFSILEENIGRLYRKNDF